MDFNDKDTIDAQLAKYILQESSSKEKEDVQYWIHANKQNEKYYEDFLLLWNKSNTASPQGNGVEEDAWQRFLTRLQQQDPIVKPMSVRQKRTLIWRVAACLVIIFTVGFVCYNWNKDKNITVQSHDMVHKEMLPDGSIIDLNKHSNLSYKSSFNKKEREVDFYGEGFFRVAPNKQIPFVIHTGQVRIEVVGTSFNVNNTRSATEITVQTGIVKVASQGKEMELHPNEKAIISSDKTSNWQKTKSDADLYSYYATGRIVCDKTPLIELVAKLNTIYGVEITISDPQKANLEITTTFDHESVDEVINIIQKTLNLQIEKQGKSIKIL